MRRRDSTHRSHRREARGFTLLELLVVMAAIMLVATLGYVGFQQMMVRTRLQGDAVAISNALQRARSQAVRYSTAVVAVATDDPTDMFEFYFDLNGDLIRDPGEDDALPPVRLTYTGRPETTVYFWSADSDNPELVPAMDGLTGRGGGESSVVVIEADGSVRDVGGIRIGMGPLNRTVAAKDDYERNFMEVRIVTTATGRTELRKFIPGDIGSDPPYQPRMTSADGSPNWKFYH